jgi:hypothetical protein
MTLNPSDKQGLQMRAGWYMVKGKKVVQPLVREGKAIGIKKVLLERGLWPKAEEEKKSKDEKKGKRRKRRKKGKNKKKTKKEKQFLLNCKGVPNATNDCCACHLLASQPDFASQTCALAEALAAYNNKHGTHHLIDFLPKFHPELNPIERFWASLKRWLRDEGGGDGIKKHRAQVVKGLAGEAVQAEEFGRYFRKSFRMMDAYRRGCSYTLAAFAAKKYKNHRTIPTDATLEKIIAECAKKKGVRT